MKSMVVNATEFKAKCLALLDQVDAEGGTITITKRGRPVAVVGPVRKERLKSPAGMWAGKVDLSDFADIDTAELWDCVRK
jgi:prevent-host-death family protein